MAVILIAEDDSAMRRFLVMALHRAGHEVHACADGLSALAALKGEDPGGDSRDGDGNSPRRFDLLLADVVMPGMDGIELSQKALALYPALKVMFITGFAAVAADHRVPGARSAPILSKPFHLKELVDQVENLLAPGGRGPQGSEKA